MSQVFLPEEEVPASPVCAILSPRFYNYDDIYNYKYIITNLAYSLPGFITIIIFISIIILLQLLHTLSQVFAKKYYTHNLKVC